MSVTRRDVLGVNMGGSLPGLSSNSDGPALAHAGHHPPSHATVAAGSPQPAGPDAYARYNAEMHAGMNKMMQDMHAGPPSGDPDVDFLTMMIPHHAGAVEMARLVLRDGHDPLVREIAERIMASQLAEIDGMRGRLSALRAGQPRFPTLTGNRGP